MKPRRKPAAAAAAARSGPRPRAVSLFSGCGGSDAGVIAAGLCYASPLPVVHECGFPRDNLDMLEFLSSVPAIVNRAERRGSDPYERIQKRFVVADISANSILDEAMARTRIQLDQAFQALTREQQANTQRSGSA